ncbi:purine-cytosine permease family protein [Arthrobacter sp. D2-10]
MKGSKSTAVEEVEHANTFGSLPLLKSERVWNATDFSWVNVALAIATWAFLVGGATASFVGFQQGVAAMIIGNAIGLCFMVLASTVASQRYGVEQYTILRPVFGVVGVGILVFTVVLITEMGWSSLLGIMVGRATTQVANVATGAEFGEYGVMVILGALLAIAVAWLILSRGPVTIGKLNKYIGPGLLVITALLMVFLVLNTSWATLLNAAPLAPFEDPQLNFAIAVEFNVGVGVSWYPVMGSLARMTNSPRAAIWPAYGGLLIATLLAQIVGMGAALTLGDSDPTVWMIPFGGPLLGAFILLFICFANITSMSSIVYSTVLALRQSSGKLLRGLHWKWLCAGFFVLPAILAFFPQFMYERFVLFVTLSGAFLAAMCGAIIADYFILRKQRIDLADLYAPGSSSAYHLPGGVNWAGMGAVVLGAAFYLWLYNPITLETQPAFNVITASLPAAVVGGLVHWILATILYKRRGLGGFDAGEPITSKGTTK